MSQIEDAAFLAYLLAEHGPMRVPEIIDAVGLGRDALNRRLQLAVRSGVVYREETGLYAASPALPSPASLSPPGLGVSERAQGAMSSAAENVMRRSRRVR